MYVARFVLVHMHIHIHIYIYIYIYLFMYMYMYIGRDRYSILKLYVCMYVEVNKCLCLYT